MRTLVFYMNYHTHSNPPPPSLTPYSKYPAYRWSPGPSHPGPNSGPLVHILWATSSLEMAFLQGSKGNNAPLPKPFRVDLGFSRPLYINISHEALTISRFYSFSLTSEPTDTLQTSICTIHMLFLHYLDIRSESMLVKYLWVVLKAIQLDYNAFKGQVFSVDFINVTHRKPEY